MNDKEAKRLTLFNVDPPTFEELVNAPVPAHRHASDTEAMAAETIAPTVGTLRRKVLRWVVDAGAVGLTGKQLGALYARSTGRDENDASARYSAMPRATELSQAGFIKDSGARRDRSIVWIATDAGIAAAADSE